MILPGIIKIEHIFPQTTEKWLKCIVVFENTIFTIC